MFIKLYQTKTLDNYFFKTINFSILFMALISAISIILNWDFGVVIPTLAIFITPCIFMSWPRFRNNVFSVTLVLILFVFIYVPLTYISIIGENYIFGWGLNSLPYSQQEYMNSYIGNLYFFFVCIFATFLSLSIFPTKFCKLKSEESLHNFGPIPILIIGAITLYILTQDILISLAAKASNEAGSEGLIKFLFFDHAYLFIAGIGLMTATNKNPNSLISQKRSIVIISILFIGVGMLAGSKASWLGIFFFFFLVTYSYIRTNQNSQILFPSIPLAIFVVIAAPILYFTTFFYRIAITSSFEFNFFEALSLLDASALNLLAEEVFYRLSAGGFDRFMLISTTFLSSDISSYGIQEYIPYMIKNLINLLMPGTIYPEAYAPTSQLFSDVIQTKPLDGGVSSSFLLRSINSQAYTIACSLK